MTERQATPEEMAAHLGVSVENFQRMMKEIEETDRKLNRGYQKMVAEHPYRNWQLSILRNYKMTPHPNAGCKVRQWELHQFHVTPEDENFQRMRAILSSSEGGRYVVAGDYTQLLRDGTVVMSDTDDELLDMWELWEQFEWEVERVIINGLGLGCALKMVLDMPSVRHVDVVELDADVISLAPLSLTNDPRVEIHHGDAYTYQFPVGTKWDIAWHDIWDEISIDNDFATLHRRYGRRVSWQASWARQAAVRAYRRRER